MGMERVMGLSVDQKLELVQKELEDTKEEIRHMRANAERDLQHHEVGLPVGRPPWAPRFCLSKKHLYYAHMIVGALREMHSDKIN